tara:strand:- start:929 stop:2278 length:1350 start_codon:yes stop_codon:yes gene_type:complete
MLLYKPNIQYNVLFVLCDQLRHDSVGYINPLVSTPNIDKLATQSFQFTNNFVQSPQCCPSRASILSGSYPNSIKMWWNDSKFEPDSPTLGQIFKGAGYQTAYFGKWHLQGNSNPNQMASHHGFDTNYLYNNWKSEYKHTDSYKEFMESFECKGLIGAKEHPEKHHDTIMTDKAIDYINRSGEFRDILRSGGNSFTLLSYHGPHAPYSAPQKYLDIYDDSKLLELANFSKTKVHSRFVLDKSEWSDLRRRYYGCISWIDDHIGRLLNSCDLSNTIVVLTSDHGDILGEHQLWDKGLYAYDPVVRTPLLIKVPGMASKIYDGLTESVDLFSTLLSVNNLHGTIYNRNDLVSLASNQLPGKEFVFSCIGKYQPRVRMVRTKEFKYWWGFTEPGCMEYLFDLKKDPQESNNLFNQLAELCKRKHNQSQFFNRYYENLSQMRQLLIKAMIYSES